MLLVPCPYCGPRPQIEFRCGGEAHIKRPDPATATDQDWAEYLYYRANPKGRMHQRYRLRPVVQRRPRHGERPVPRFVPAGRACSRGRRRSVAA